MALLNPKITIEIFPQRLNEPGGAVNEAVKAAADDLLEAAIENIGDEYGGHHPQSIASSGRVEPTGSGAYEIIFDLERDGYPIAVIHHDGADPHDMPARGNNKNPYYRNGPGKVTSRGDTVFKSLGPIEHPGSDGNPFLTNAANESGLRPSGGLKRGERLARIFRVIT